MGDQLRLFEQERIEALGSGILTQLHHLEARELSQQLVIARKYNRKSYIKRLLQEAKRRRIQL